MGITVPSDDLLLSLLWIVPLGGVDRPVVLPRAGRRRRSRAFALGDDGLTLLLARYVAWRVASVSPRPAPGPPGASGHRFRLRPRRPGGPPRLDPRVRYPVLPRPRRDQHEPDPAVEPGRCVLACLASWKDRSGKGQGLLRPLPAPRTSSLMGVVPRARPGPLLRLLRGHAPADVLPDRHLGRRERREYAAIKFLLYTLFGSVFILVAILILYFWPGDAPRRSVARASRASTRSTSS